MTNFYANIGKRKGTRDPVDRYETPSSVTLALLNRIELPRNVREPACGTGRMTRVLRDWGYKVHATDIVENGVDFLKTRKRLDSCVTNPPYRDGLAEAFVRHALELTDGPVAMLLRTGFLNSGGRYMLFKEHKPDAVFYLCKRILFFQADGTRISGQAHDHCWVVWNCDWPTAGSLDWIGPEETPDVGRS